MKINQKILSIPPYISTSWKNIASLHVESEEEILLLVVTLLNGVSIEIPDLSADLIEIAFIQHAKFIETEERPSNKAAFKHPIHLAMPQEQMFSFGFPLKGVLGGMENLSSILQHNPNESDAPNLPQEVLERIAEMAKTIGIDDLNTAPKPEPSCNCIHCQITGALHKGTAIDDSESLPELEEVVSDEDLKFRTWDIAQSGDKLFIVTNASDSDEHYSVFLGEPIGCTCGEKHCEHIRAVLNS